MIQETAVRASRLLGVAVAASLLGVGLPALATPRPLPFTYTADTLAAGETEIEQYVDLTPVVATSASTGSRVWYTATQFQTEFEHGITDHLELGLYIALQPDPGSAYVNPATLTEGTGFKERLRWGLADPGQWPIDVALYGELVEYTNEFEIEAKVILERRFGRLRIAANAWAEREFYFALPQQDWVLNPTIGATYQITPAFHAGLEYWMRVELPDPAPNPRPFSVGPNQFVGPAVMFNLGHLWWSTGIYGRVNDIGRTAEVGDNYGPIWARTVVGLEL
jgi:hypothetical protein